MTQPEPDNTIPFNSDTSSDTGSDTKQPQSSATPFSFNRFGQAMVPFAPVSFKTDPALAWVRVAVYGAVAMASWNKHKKISYVAMGALALSTATSLVEFK